ncbi:efflux RND transporter periplasmic adaptor subunit [Luteolibacter pohnpeiensis]|uniref:Efflux RND transporter periplasmic adaptor subunit n=1 Tax=Luteolibacter pohnpeiensis TaxID=454153 RepID=A0A934VVN9_9BACT|nr:efflux RND transporter periplasmic adaptor subunit [Luteolibacter pohnpeiensis]MBK1881704.1 efflux RND transporter periplasmic adaptor subunit [Luteolibacter pohnpeiensis]
MQPHLFIPLTLATFLILPSCKKEEAAGPPPGPTAVSVLPAGTEDVSITREYPGRIDAVRTADVRARVPGILLQKKFVEGAEVQKGDVLFQIDPEPLQAARDSAAASLATAKANSSIAEVNVKRLRGLSASNAVSQQDLDDAENAVALANAQIQGAEAALKTAELNLGYATVTAPISGRIGRAIVTEGALVGEGEATLLATIQQLDPIYFDFTQPSGDMISLRQAMEKGSLGKVPDDQTGATLILENGTEYSVKGRILFSEVTVDETTGMVTLRAEFPNPDRVLLPGMFARIRVVEAIRKDAVTVLQRAVTRQQNGKASVMVVNDKNEAQLKMIETADPVGDKWVVTSGLQKGDTVIIEGMKAFPGTKVVTEPYTPKAPDKKTGEG